MATSSAGRHTIRLRIGRGARQAEALLIDAVLSSRRAIIAESGPLGGSPVAVIVPSRSLRLHVLRLLASLRRPELAVGVRCLTVYGLATQLAERPPEELPETVELLCERFARRHPDLDGLRRLRDGYASVSAQVRDLLDAGLRPELADGLVEVLETPEVQAAGPAALTRARALIEVAARTDAALETLNLPSRHGLYRQAAETVMQVDSPRFASIVVHGFAEATGVVSDFLVALLQSAGGQVVLSAPPDPVQAEAPAAGGLFIRRLRERMELIAAGEETETATAADLPRLRLVEAPDPSSEVEEIAQRVRDLLDDGAAPEGIGIVMRDPSPYRSPLRRRFARLAVPYSAPDLDGPPLPSHRWLGTLQALLEQSAALPAERWLELLSPAGRDAAALDLSLVLAARGVARLVDVARMSTDALEDEPPSVPLPLPRVTAATAGAESAPDADGSATDGDRLENELPRPTVSRDELMRLTESARGLVALLERWSNADRLEIHRASLHALLHDHLDWPADSEATREINEAVLRPLSNLPGELPVDYEEFRGLVGRLLRRRGRERLGGEGGGVQVLDVMSARARTFDHLFVLGLNRGNFPRTVREDALLPDVVREALSRTGHGPLPDLPRKRAGFDEENHLFAELLSAAPEVRLSWSVADADGQVLTASPWVERLRSALHLELERAPGLWQDPDSAPGETPQRARRLARRPPQEWARLAALTTDRAAFSRVMPHAFAHTQGASLQEAQARANARQAVLDELDPDLATSHGRSIWGRLGPYSGLTGPDDQRHAEDRVYWVTELEDVARCPWQAFLQHDLRLEPWPDSFTTLPDLDGRLVGSAVHSVLQSIAQDVRPNTAQQLDEAISAASGVVTWPTDQALHALVLRIAQSTLEHEGMHLPGLVHGLTARVRPLLMQARALAWPKGSNAIRGVEVTGETTAADHPVRFRVDQIREHEDRLELVDFKTGRPLADRKTMKSRRDHLLRALAEGRALQAAVYARAAGTTGIYLYLTDLHLVYEEARRIEVDADDEAAMRRLDRVVDLLVEAQRNGVRIPRLNEKATGDRRRPRMCDHCAVAPACLQHESTARNRQRHWIDAHAEEGDDSPLAGIASALWWMRPPADAVAEPEETT